MNKINIEFPRLSKLKKIVIWSVLLFIPLSSYATPIEGFTVGDFLLVLILLLVLIDVVYKKKNLKRIIATPPLLFLLYIFTFSLIYAFFEPEIISYGTLSTLRYIMYMLFAAIFSKYYMDRAYTYNIYKNLTMIFSYYMIFQFLYYYLVGGMLPSTIPGLPITYSAVPIEEYMMKSYLLYRPSSVFVEPAHFVVYQIPALYLLLNGVNLSTEKKNLTAFVLTTGLLLSGSSTAYILLVLCWIRPILKTLLRMKIKSLGLLVLMLIAASQILNTNYSQVALSRLFRTPTLEQGSSLTGRVGMFEFFVSGDITYFQRIFGFGFGYDTGFYLPSYGTLMLYMGFMGVFVFTLFILYAYINSSKDGQRLITIYLVTFLGTNALFGITSVLYFSLLFSDIGSKNYKKHSNRFKNEKIKGV